MDRTDTDAAAVDAAVAPATPLTDRSDRSDGSSNALSGPILDWVLHLERLAQAGSMAGGLANGVLDALTAIAGTCQVGLLERDPDRLREALTRASGLAMRAAEATNVFLTFARAGHPSTPVSACDGVVDDALRFVSSALKAHRTIVEVDVPRGISAACDRTRLMQVVVDVILHLLRGSSSSTTLRVSAVAESGEAVLRLRMDPSRLEPNEPTPVASEAPGDPLFLTRRIVEEVGGRILVDSSRARGMEVVLRLPAAATAAERAA